MGLLSPLIRDCLRAGAEGIRGQLLNIGCGNLSYRDLFCHVDESMWGLTGRCVSRHRSVLTFT